MTDKQLLIFRTKLESLITEREAMLVLNQWREMRGESQAHSEDAFFNLKQRFDALENLINAVEDK